MKVFRYPCGAVLMLGALFLASGAGCSSLSGHDPVNPSKPYVFPGQGADATATAAVASSPGSAATTSATPGVNTTTAPQPTPGMPGTPGEPVIPVNTSTVVRPAPVVPANPVLPSTSTILRPGDSLHISFTDIPAPGIMPIIMELGEDGKITLPFNIIINAIGKTPRALEQEIRGEYVPKYYRYLTVTVKTDQRFYHVGGEVKMPGQINYRGEITVLRAIEAAGGMNDFAKRSKVMLTRQNGEKHTVHYDKALKDPKKDLPVYPGDYIYVPKRLW